MCRRLASSDAPTVTADVPFPPYVHYDTNYTRLATLNSLNVSVIILSIATARFHLYSRDGYDVTFCLLQMMAIYAMLRKGQNNVLKT